MSSASELRRARWSMRLAAPLLALALAAAAQEEPSDAVPMARTVNKGQVGPEPGPGDGPAGARNPYSGDRRAAREGRQLFVAMNCAGCHGTHAGGGMGPSLRDAQWLYGNHDGQIFDSIAQGRSNGMPAWGNQLPEDMIWKIVGYIQTLRTSEEPDPPR